MPSELSQTENEEVNELMTRDWGQEFILYDRDDPGAVWLSINSSELIDLRENR